MGLPSNAPSCLSGELIWTSKDYDDSCDIRQETLGRSEIDLQHSISVKSAEGAERWNLCL
jgi:hypothetical protein